MLHYKVVVKRHALVLKVGVVPTEYCIAFIKVARQITTVYKVGVAPTDYIEHTKLVLK